MYVSAALTPSERHAALRCQPLDPRTPQRDTSAERDAHRKVMHTVAVFLSEHNLDVRA